jgi:hypothetical protein
VIYQEKTQILHFRKKGMQRSAHNFCLGTNPLFYTGLYKYCGFTLDEHMTFEDGIISLEDSEGRALGSVLNKINICKDRGYCTYSQLYKSCVSSDGL